MKIAVIGLPFSGKSTIFNIFQGTSGNATPKDSRKKHNICMATIPDERLDFLFEHFKPPKKKYVKLEIHDSPSLTSLQEYSTKNKAEIIANLREADGFANVVRYFDDENFPHVHGNLNLKRDVEELESELHIADFDIVEKRIEKLHQSLKKPLPKHEREQDEKELEILNKLKTCLEKEKKIEEVQLSNEEKRIIRGYRFLTEKPSVIIINKGEEKMGEKIDLDYLKDPQTEVIEIFGKLEFEISQLEDEEQEMFLKDMGIGESKIDALLKQTLKGMNCISFFTIGKEEVRAWAIQKGESAVNAAGKIHTDMEKGFIRAEVVAFDDFKNAGSMKEAKNKGKVRLEGKEYVVQDGDIIQFKFSV